MIVDRHNSMSTPNQDDQVLTQLCDALLRCVVSLCSKPPGQRPKHIGTGVLFEVNGQHFIVSARHVFDDVNSLFFYVKRNVIRKLTGQLMRGRLERGEPDTIDVAVFRLEGSCLPPYDEVDKSCLLDISMVLPSAMPRQGKQYLVTGYPSSRSNANPHAMEFKSDAWSLVTEACEPAVYQQLDRSEKHHLVLTLDRHNTFGKRVFPDPHGMSGAPVWLLPDESNVLELPALVGIVIEHHKKFNALVATDIHEAMVQIKAFDDIRASAHKSP